MDALTAFFRRINRRLRRRGRSPEDAEDMVQEAFLRMQQYCAEGGTVAEPEAFLARTVRHLLLNARRDSKRDLYVAETPDELPLLDLTPRPEDVLAVEERLKRIWRTLDAINPRTREVFFLHRVDGLSYTQIAQHFAISVSAIEKHIARATAALTDEVLRK